MASSIPSATDTNLAQFHKDFKGVIATKTSGDDYKIERWSTQTDRQAAYVVFPTDANDISKAILFARAEKLPLAIACGRHHSAGASSVEGGLIIDMRKMNAVRVDKENKIGHIQGGANVRHVQEETIKYGMATTIGMCGTVGFGGYTLGGGVGFATGEHGLSSDNIISATVVLANGVIVEANEDDHPDLLWGLKGAGSNFGVVAEFRMRTWHQRPDIHVLDCIYVPQSLSALVAEINEWLKVQIPQETRCMGFVLGPDGNPYVHVSGWGNFSEEEGLRRWKRFLDLGPIKRNNSQISYEKLTTPNDPFCDMPGNKTIKGVYVSQFDPEAVQATFDRWLETAKQAPQSAVIYEFYDFKNIASVPVAATPFAHRSTDACVIIAVAWTDPTFAPHVQTALGGIATCAVSSSTAYAKDSVGYTNHADVFSVQNETDDYARRAFGPNYPRLQEVKRKYDPDVVFNKWFCIRPAAGRP